MKQAVRKIAPSVVQIVTQGGAEMVRTAPKGPAFRKALGPTTGVIVSPDGYIISSAFNFVNDPTSILVVVPGRKDPLVAKQIATDRTRMLTLLKINAKDLPVPEATPKKEIRVGRWALAVGRTFDTRKSTMPSVTVGIISALNRVWGKAIQTDANLSPANYGGPLIDILGRVQAIIVPASPRSEGETAGFEWYDSGIGFAIPMEDVREIVPKLKKGKDLKKGLLGIRPRSRDLFRAAAVIGQVSKGSAAEKAGLKAGDTIVEIDGKPVLRMAQLRHILGPKYEGDVISLKYKRGDKVHTVAKLELAGKVQKYTHPYIGTLPMRDYP